VKENGKVIKRISSNVVEIEIKESPSCAKCGMCIFKPDGRITLKAIDKTGVEIGNIVEVNIPESRVLLSSLLIFILPIIVFFSGYMIKGVILASILLFIYLAFLFFYDRRSKLLPNITRVLSNN